MDTEENNYNRIKNLVMELGAVAFGVARYNNPGLFPQMERCISVAIGLSKGILSQIKDHPTKLYFHHYRQANNLLDHIAMRVTQLIQQAGFDAIPIPASQIIDWDRQRGHISHKVIAEEAGIGWLGRNNLIIHPIYGAHIRLVSIMTNMPIKTDSRLNQDCGDCKRCLDICPVSAIKESQRDFDHIACFEKLKEFRKEGYVSQYICGICVKVCKGKSDLTLLGF